MKNHQTDDRLPDLLRTWQVNPVRSAAFSTNVWRKIEASRSQESWRGFVHGHPAMLAILLAAATTVGGWGGAELARVRVDTQTSAMADAYVQALDARQMNMP